MLTNSRTNRKWTYQKECIDLVSISTLLSALNERLQVHMIRNGLNLYKVDSVRGHWTPSFVYLLLFVRECVSIPILSSKYFSNRVAAKWNVWLSHLLLFWSPHLVLRYHDNCSAFTISCYTTYGDINIKCCKNKRPPSTWFQMAQFFRTEKLPLYYRSRIKCHFFPKNWNEVGN